MNYWIDLFTGTTWSEFRRAGAKVSGFRAARKGIARNVKEGDIFLCYLTGVKRWIGALEVLGRSTNTEAIWSGGDPFPVRFDVRPLVILEPETGVPMEDFEGKLDFYAGPQHRGKFQGFLRGSPNRFKKAADGELILRTLRAAEKKPIERPVDQRQLDRKYRVERQKGRKRIHKQVTVPEPDDVTSRAAPAVLDEPAAVSLHTEMQYRLLRLGADLGLSVWVARNDRSKVCGEYRLGEMPGLVNELPDRFNEATARTIELIDVLWLKGRSIVAAFEVESTTSIYSGLLRMSDLLALEPDLDIQLFIVAPDERRSKVEQEILRPTFNLGEKPLSEKCGFLPFDAFKKHADAIAEMGLAPSLKFDFLEKMAVFFRDEGRSGD